MSLVLGKCISTTILFPFHFLRLTLYATLRLSRFQNEPGLETTKKTITDVFFPGDHDAKSVLLKRGPILLDGVDEREILLFTHGFLLHKLEFDTLLNILFTINSENPQYLNSKQLEDRFNAIDSDRSGCE